MSDLKLEVGKLYKTRGGQVRRVVCVDVPGEHPLISVARSDFDTAFITMNHHSDGSVADTRESGFDLIAEHREPREWEIITAHNTSSVKVEGPSINYGERIRVREVLDND